MKHLFENWRKHLDEATLSDREFERRTNNFQKTGRFSNILDYNANMVRAIAIDNSSVREHLKAHWNSSYDEIGHLEEFFSQIPTLFEEGNEITGLSGVGTLGIVFELSNGHVIKFFGSGYLSSRGGAEEMKFYASEKTRIFDRKGDVRTLPIYDQGEAESKGDTPYNFPRRINWVEMARVVTFYDYMEKTGRPAEFEHVDGLVSSLHAIFDMKRHLDGAQNPSALDVANFKKEIAFNTKLVFLYSQDMELCVKEFLGIFEMLKSVYEKYGKKYLADIHGGNFGILEPTLPRVSYPHKGIKGSVSCKDMHIPAFILFDP